MCDVQNGSGCPGSLRSSAGCGWAKLRLGHLSLSCPNPGPAAAGNTSNDSDAATTGEEEEDSTDLQIKMQDELPRSS